MKKLVGLLLIFGASSYASEQDQKGAAAGKQAQAELTYTPMGDTGVLKIKRQGTLVGLQLPFDLTLSCKTWLAERVIGPKVVKFSELSDEDQKPFKNLMSFLRIESNTPMVAVFHTLLMHKAFGHNAKYIYTPDYLPISFLEKLNAKQPVELELSHDPELIPDPIKALYTLSEAEQKTLATLAAQLAAGTKD